MWKSQNTRFIFSPEAAAEYLPICSMVSRPCAPSKSWSTKEASSPCASRPCQSGTTCGRSAPTTKTAPECSPTCANTRTTLSLLADFPAKIFHARAKAREYAEKEADFGRSTHVSFAKFDPVSFSWKIPHFLFQGDWDKFSETWPRWGMMVRGECFRLPPWERDTGATAFGELSCGGIETAEESAPWPTPTVFGNGNRSEYGGKSGDGLDTAVKRAAESATGPTPTCAGLDGGSNSRRAARARGRYIEGAKSAPWPTPTVRDSHGITQTGKPIDLLVYAVERGVTKSHNYPAAESAPWPTPTAHAAKPVCNEKPRDGLNYAVERGETKSHTYPTVGTKTMVGCSGSFAKLKELERLGRLTPEERRAMSSHLTGGKDPDKADVGMLNPDWVEWLMDWPKGWTDIDIVGGVFLWLDMSDDPAEWTPPLMPRITRRKRHRVPRIETLGNGQVPLCAAVAFVFGFEILRIVIEGRRAA